MSKSRIESPLSASDLKILEEIQEMIKRAVQGVAEPDIPEALIKHFGKPKEPTQPLH